MFLKAVHPPRKCTRYKVFIVYLISVVFVASSLTDRMKDGILFIRLISCVTIMYVLSIFNSRQ